MFVEAIKKISQFTRPIHTILRNYGDNAITPGAGTLFFVNELGVAITCRHIADILAQSEGINVKYVQFREERNSLSPNKKFRKNLKSIEVKYGYNNTITSQIKVAFYACVDNLDSFQIIPHPTLDLAIIKFNGFKKLLYDEYAIFQKDDTQAQQGKSLCRLGYPFPEFTNYKYNSQLDDIEWTQEGAHSTPRFPIDGILTRQILGNDGAIIGLEMSTPGLRGQSGGPLFDTDGKIYGMQASTHHLHLGFDIKNKEILADGKKMKVSNHPFLHLGHCVSLGVIKAFLKEHNVKFYEE